MLGRPLLRARRVLCYALLVLLLLTSSAYGMGMLRRAALSLAPAAARTAAAAAHQPQPPPPPHAGPALANANASSGGSVIDPHGVAAARRVLFVCAGNTDRSVMAETLARAALAGCDLAFSSAGVAVAAAAAAARSARPVSRETHPGWLTPAALEGLGVAAPRVHAPRALTPSVLGGALSVYCADARVLAAVLAMPAERESTAAVANGGDAAASAAATTTAAQHPRIDLFTAHLSPAERGTPVDDPHGGTLAEFIATARLVARCVDAIIAAECAIYGGTRHQQ